MNNQTLFCTGTFAPGSTGSCSQCAAGKYCASDGCSSCDNCAAGKSSSAGASSCISVPCNVVVVWDNNGSWREERFVDIYNSAGAKVATEYYSTTPQTVTLMTGSYTVQPMDSYGDGWNGGTARITQNGNTLVELSFSGSGSAYAVSTFTVNSC